MITYLLGDYRKILNGQSIIDLFKNGIALVKISIIISIAFMVNKLIFFGLVQNCTLSKTHTIYKFEVHNLKYYIIFSLAFNAAELAGNLYVNNAINGFVDLLGFLLCSFLLGKHRPDVYRHSLIALFQRVDYYSFFQIAWGVVF